MVGRVLAVQSEPVSSSIKWIEQNCLEGYDIIIYIKYFALGKYSRVAAVNTGFSGFILQQLILCYCVTDALLHMVVVMPPLSRTNHGSSFQQCHSSSSACAFPLQL